MQYSHSLKFCPMCPYFDMAMIAFSVSQNSSHFALDVLKRLDSKFHCSNDPNAPMESTRSPPSILTLIKAYGLGFDVAFGSIKTVKLGISTYDHFAGPQNMAVAFPRESAVIQYNKVSKPCPTCFYVDLDDNLLDYYGRPVDVDQLVT